MDGTIQSVAAPHITWLDSLSVNESQIGAGDAAGPCAAGIPAVMYGVGGGDWPLGEDFVPISHLVQVAQVMAHTVLSVLS